jgi:hypothetical protein
MVKGHKIEKRVKIEDFRDMMDRFTEYDLITTEHTFFRLRQGDRKVFKDIIIKDYLLGQEPLLVGLQFNRNYAVFYRYGKDILKIILDVQADKIYVVTFYIMNKDQLPRL